MMHYLACIYFLLATADVFQITKMAKKTITFGNPLELGFPNESLCH